MTALLERRAAISLEEAAQLLGVTKRSMQRYAASGQLPTFRLGGRRYVPTAWLRALLEVDQDKAGDGV